MMIGEFVQSAELKSIIENLGWTLYDITEMPKGKPYTWDEIEQIGPAEKYEIGHNYIFAPIPEKGQTLRESYSQTKGLGPSMTIENIEDDRWLDVEVSRKLNGYVALFSRLNLLEPGALLCSPPIYFMPYSDIVAIDYDQLVDTFEKYFRIVTPEEYGLKAPIETPIIPELN